MDASFTVDVERDLHTGRFEGITHGLPRLLGILDRYHIKATFFVTGEVMEKYPRLIRGIAKKGHEIALHSYNHKRYDQMSKEEKEKDLKKTLKAYLKLFKRKPLGFRAPQHSADNQTFDLLAKFGLKYDSSRVPGNILLLRHLFRRKANIQNILGNFLSKLSPYRTKQGLIEIPSPTIIMAPGSFELKIYPKIAYKLLMALSRLLRIPLIFSVHSWDMIDISGSRISRFCPEKDFEKKLGAFLEYSTKKIKYRRMDEIIKKC
jgi:peptidoglycan/xylan/chitin deacetylase (PgdA/CDA1 family)